MLPGWLERKGDGALNAMIWEDRLSQLGMLRPVSSGLQLDVTAVIKKNPNGSLSHASLCDHNCVAHTGHYACPSAASLNTGVVAGSLASARQIVKGTEVALQALLLARERFLKEHFSVYCDDFQIPADVATCLAEAIRSRPVEINLTGGNPEVHPEIDQILVQLSKLDHVTINLTTTGRRVMLSEDFCALLAQNPPDILSLSADAFENAEEIYGLAVKTREELIDLWQGLPQSQGQKQKAIEAIFVARQFKDLPGLHAGFNVVVHQGNIAQIEQMLKALAETFPGAHLFPYPVQTACFYEPSVFNDLTAVEAFVDSMIAAHFQDDSPVTRRLQYWLMLKAVILTYGDDAETALNMIGGHGLWRCYKNPGTIRYLQVGKGANPPGNDCGGGYVGCFWNTDTVTYDSLQIWDMKPTAVADYMTRGLSRFASQVASPCPGCGFPRLLFDVVSSEMGLNERLKPEYLVLRQRYAGY